VNLVGLSQRAKHGYVRGMQHGARTLTRLGALPDEPPPRDHRYRHWLYSLPRVHDAAGLIALDVPWWTYRAIDIVESWLHACGGSARVFEWGAGASTSWLAARAGSVDSVEHDAGFAAGLSALTSGRDNVDVRLVAPVPSPRPVVGSAKPGFAGLDFAEYVAAIDDVPGEFDLIVVDGRARAACLARAVPRLAAGGMVVFDNSRRRRYRPAITCSGLYERRLRGLTPTLPYPDQTSVLTRGRADA
jgi:Methyltransferase domain